jgi:hypothetical protein
MMAHICNLSTQETEAEGLQIPVWFWLHRSASKKEKQTNKKPINNKK